MHDLTIRYNTKPRTSNPPTPASTRFNSSYAAGLSTPYDHECMYRYYKLQPPSIPGNSSNSNSSSADRLIHFVRLQSRQMVRFNEI